jgi:hypothetical protein
MSVTQYKSHKKIASTIIVAVCIVYAFIVIVFLNMKVMIFSAYQGISLII